MKRKASVDVSNEEEINTLKPTAYFKPKGGRAYTLSIALPGSIIANALTPELKTILAGQVARALAVFCVDEVVIFDDGQGKQSDRNQKQTADAEQNEDLFTGFSDPDFFLTHILSYLETPPFLRRHLFPIHPDLKYAGSLPSLDMPHHLRPNDPCPFREGVTVETERAYGDKKKKRKAGNQEGQSWTLVDVGLSRKILVPDSIPPKTRLTVRMREGIDLSKESEDLVTMSAIAPDIPREEAGFYWGYNVRSASSLSTVITECEYEGGYDLTFGTSERGVPISTLDKGDAPQSPLPRFKHMLVVFGGLGGLEVAAKGDSELYQMGVKEPRDLFDYWVNVCPGQGSRTIRTEEAIWLGLMGLRDIVLTKGKK